MKQRISLLSLYFLTLLCSFNCKKPNSKSDFTLTKSGLQYKIIKEGMGEPVKVGQHVLIHETMSYRNDSLLFDSRNLPGPVKVLVGGSQAIRGVDEGLVGMKKGEIKLLIVPPVLSKRSAPTNVPHPDSTLVYEIELMDILNEN